MEKIVSHKRGYITWKTHNGSDLLMYMSFDKDAENAYHFDSFNEARLFVKNNSDQAITEFEFHIVKHKTIIDRICDEFDELKKGTRKPVAIYLGRNEYDELIKIDKDSFIFVNKAANKFNGVDLFRVIDENHFNVIGR